MSRKCFALTVLLCAIMLGLPSLEASQTASGKKPAPKRTNPVWITDFKAAIAYARKYDRPILADFTGSDWCGYCIKLKKEVFNRPEFKKYASENFILLQVDFPARKPQSSALKAQNKALVKKYGIRGYPTVLLLDGEGKVMKKTGYMRGGVKKYLQHLDQLLGKNKK